MVAPAIAIDPCTSGEYDALLALLDQEFIFGRGRRISLQQRFPAVVQREHPENMLLARADGQIAAALAIRPFAWITPQRSWRAAMIGMVWTRPDWRGRGIASALMQAAQARMALAGYAFGVLWAAQPGFYARLGWEAMDCGVLGKIQTENAEMKPAAARPDAAMAFIETLRRRHAPDRIERSKASYATVLPHAEQLEFLPSGSAYAIVGRMAERGYLYEMLGEAADFPALWAMLDERYRTLYLNVRRGSAAEVFLAEQDGIQWQAQQLAMWLPLAGAAHEARFGEWYIPFLDRI